MITKLFVKNDAKDIHQDKQGAELLISGYINRKISELWVPKSCNWYYDLCPISST